MEGVRKRGRKSRRKQCKSAEQPKTEEKPADTAKKAKRKRRRGRKKPQVQITMENIPVEEVVVEKVEMVEVVEKPKPKINRSWLDFDNDEEENNVPSVEEALAEISPCIIHQETTSRQINNYSSRFFCPGEVPRTAIPEIQEDNDTLLRTKQKRDTTKRSRRKTEPFNFEKQADGDITEMFRDFKIEDEVVSSLPDLPGGLCSFMADSAEKTSKNVDGRGIYSGSISEDGMFVRSPDFGTSELSRQDSLERIFDDDYDFEQSSEDCGVNSDAECSDEEEGACDLGDLPPEPQLGNVEYKLKLVKPSKQKFEHLVTQMKWRLREGQGEALYQIGVRDCGRVHGLARGELRSSLRTLRRMAARLGASCALVARGHLPGTKRARAEVLVTKVPDDQHNIEVRVAVMGSNDAGKSTLVGVLTQGELDNGRGSARLNMFRHLHEVKTGRTSSVSHEILGFDSQGRAINYAYSELMTSEEITDRSSKLINFIDLAGHRKYLKTTVQGVTGYAPHYAMLVVSATAGMNQMSLEHLAIVVALDLPFFVVITKTDCMCFDLTMQQLRQELTTIGCRKVPLPVLTLDDVTLAASNVLSCLTVPVFPVSSVNGDGLDLLRWFLFLAPPAMSVNERDRLEQEPVVFQVDETFKLGDSNGPVVGGLLKKGILTEKTKLLIGPLDSGEFVPITVNSLHRNKAPCRVVRAGQAAALGLSSQPPGLRQGMVLIAIPDNYAPIVKTSNTSDDPRLAFLSSKSGDIFWRGDLSPKIRKKMRKKRSMKTSNQETNDKESSNVTKLSASRYSDRYKSASENTTPAIPKPEISTDNLSSGEDDERPPPLVKDEMVDSGKEVTEEEVSDVDILVRDNPNDPRGCFFFQATVSVLSHSAAIYPGFQSTVHIGNIRQTAVIEGILSSNSVLRSKDRASVLFRFLRHPEYVRPGARILFREALHTKGIGRVTQVFPHRGPQICCHN